MDEISQKVQELNTLLGAAGRPFSLGYYDPRKLKLLETNARFMPNDKFAALVANVKRDGGLASVPLVYAFDEPETPLVLSGNHRIMAARAAATGPELCMVISARKTVDELVAIQLSHNAIAGADDLQTLKKLCDQIHDIDMKMYSGIDEDTLKKLEAIKFEAISEPRLVFKTVTMLFLPHEIDELNAMLSEVDKLLEDENSYALKVADYQEFFEMLANAKSGLKIKNTATALLELMRAGNRQLEAELEARAKLSEAPEKEEPADAAA